MTDVERNPLLIWLSLLAAIIAGLLIGLAIGTVAVVFVSGAWV
jgi:hypothetical protein